MSAAVSTWPAPSPVAACGCGCTYAQDEWMRLPRQSWELGDELLEIAECVECDSTIAVPLEVTR